MTTKTRFPLRLAQLTAIQIVADLEPYCKRLVVAGSIRRMKPDVGDIELVYIPHVEIRGQTSMLDYPPAETNLALEYLMRLASPRKLLAVRMNKNGVPIGVGPFNQYFVHLPSGIPLDCFTADIETWGMKLLVRTGPADFCKRVMSRFLELGMRGHAYGGVHDAQGTLINCPDELTVFNLLRWEYIEPEARE